MYTLEENRVPGRPNDPFGGCSDVTRRQALSAAGIGAAREKGGSPTESYRFLPRITSLSAAAHHHPFPLFFYEKDEKRNLSLSPDARTENFRSDIRFLSRIDRTIDSRRFQFLLLTLRRDDEVTQSGGAAVVAIARDLLSKQRPNIAGTRRLNESQRTRGILVEINIIATDVTGCISRRGGARVDIDTGNTPVYWVSGSKVG